MKFVIVAALVAVAAAAKLPGEPTPTPVPILRFDQQNPQLPTGAHRFQFEGGNGILFEESGNEGTVGGANRIGSFQYPAEDGSLISVSYVANENGFQPDSSILPVAPAFPHPIPQFVLDQIEKARLEDEAKAREEASKARV
ncbi:cuticle protein AMP4-like [Oratosquilla oratoria]|uniref:cuticle protein AMP4-like n=1 Tax=Oratosquilla oratoria TaxID=337810 RepID=UPI003F759FF0